MYNTGLADFLSSRIEVNDTEIQDFLKMFVSRSVRKKQLIVQPGFTASKRFYIVDGALRSFVINESGQEITIALAVKDWWITDYNSYIYQQPATLFVEALSHSVIMELSFDDEKYLKQLNPKYESFFRIIAERGLAAQQRRMIALHTQTAVQRYENFARQYPQFIQEIPQYIIASFLGMSTEFLSKIRNNKL
ncbi:Crp/Fnr family transcriptional regulator [Flavobacterium sp. J372]|uniref:Crp/Fnr family transcriptional regulator n=1 Tax=Flavobacterium sp. J372 TaxID=2898436 RepID=UPI002150EDA2|nr:Crp/Fnr family transcriptional regulator [Flavobacterium sp. J372]MCR5862608.1 Crp/Fnr family transcriptional regulator [Flavobacterium sp. J372]MCR5863655.1 Crp/Fnr family transcriptional regulator [Flavobacterium sp. J372]